MIDPKSNQNYEVIFPEGAASAIDELVTKYGFEEIEEEMLEKMDQTEIFETKEKIFENLPGRQIARTVKEICQEKILDKDFVFLLQERLNISEETAKDLAKDLKEKVLVLAQKISEIEKISLPEIKEISSPKRPFTESPEKPPSEKTDIYREPIE